MPGFARATGHLYDSMRSQPAVQPFGEEKPVSNSHPAIMRTTTASVRSCQDHACGSCLPSVENDDRTAADVASIAPALDLPAEGRSGSKSIRIRCPASDMAERFPGIAFWGHCGGRDQRVHHTVAGRVEPMTDCVLWRMTFSKRLSDDLRPKTQTVKNRPAAIITAIQIESPTKCLR